MKSSTFEVSLSFTNCEVLSTGAQQGILNGRDRMVISSHQEAIWIISSEVDLRGFGKYGQKAVAKDFNKEAYTG